MRWRESGSTWTYTFLDCTTKNPVLVTFSNGDYSRYRLWLALAIFGLNTQEWGKPPHSAFINTESLHLIFLTAFPSSPQTADNGSATSLTCIYWDTGAGIAVWPSGNERANFIFNPMLNKVADAVFYVRDREFDYRKIQPAEASAGWWAIANSEGGQFSVPLRLI